MTHRPRYPCMQIIATRGWHLDVGYNIGCTLRSNIQQYYQQSDDVQSKLEPFYSHQEGRDLYQTYLKTAQDQLPHYINEMKGMSEGAGMAFEKIFLLNISKEVYNNHWKKMVSEEKVTESAGCSDIMINRPDVKYLLHNEDCDPVVKPFGYLVKADIQDVQLDSRQHFTAYSYPGYLPGTTFGYNNHGMVFGVNGLYPNGVNVQGTPRIVLNRHMLSSENVNDALDKLKNKGYGCAFGFNLNLASIKDPENMWGIEVCLGDGESRLHLKTLPEEKDESKACHYIHVNNFRHLTVDDAATSGSTVARVKRSAEMKPPRTLRHAFEILGDTQNEHYPIYRTPSSYDDAETVATAAFNILDKRLDLYMENPKFAKTGFLSLPLDM